MAEFLGEIKGWRIPEFKDDVNNRLSSIEKTLECLNGDRIEGIEEKVRSLEDTRTGRVGMKKLLLIIAAVTGFASATTLLVSRLLAMF